MAAALVALVTAKTTTEGRSCQKNPIAAWNLAGRWSLGMFFFIESASVSSHFDVIFSIFCFDGVGCRNRTRASPATAMRRHQQRRVGSFGADLREEEEEPHHVIVMKPDGTCAGSTCVPGRGGASAPYYSMIRICTGKLSSCTPFLAAPSP
jgi:hypothetical protein